MDTAYIDRVNGRWESHTYSDGQVVRLYTSTEDEYLPLLRKLEAEGFKVVRLFATSPIKARKG